MGVWLVAWCLAVGPGAEAEVPLAAPAVVPGACAYRPPGWHCCDWLHAYDPLYEPTYRRGYHYRLVFDYPWWTTTPPNWPWGPPWHEAPAWRAPPAEAFRIGPTILRIE